MVIGLAWLAPGAEVAPDDEHDAHAWWPRGPPTGPRRPTSRLSGATAMLLSA